MLTHQGTQTIQTERLLLRRYRADDAQAMFDRWANDVRVTRFLTWPPHGSVEVTHQLLKGWCDAYADPTNYNWVIELEGQIVGGISVVSVNERSEWAELGYCLSYDCWNGGLMTEAVRAVMDYLFKRVGVNRIEIDHAVDNPASGRVAQKCGLRYEGTKSAAFKTAAGDFLDIAFYGITRSDWEKMKTRQG